MSFLSQRYKKQVELLLSVLKYISEEDRLALYGGTAINMFYREMPRYSVDIDLRYLPIESRELSLKNITEIFINIERKLKNGPLKLETHLRDDPKKLIVAAKKDQARQIKVEINPVVKGNLFPIKKISLSSKVREEFKVDTRIKINCLDKDEVFGSKICAALDRQHPRDLFDIKLLFDEGGITEKMKQSFIVHLISNKRPFHEMLHPRFKDITKTYRSEFEGMALYKISLEDILETRKLLVDEVIRILTPQDRKFLQGFIVNRPDWSLIGNEKIKEFPAVKWKLLNQKRMDPQKRNDHIDKLKFTRRSGMREYYRYWGKSKNIEEGMPGYHLLVYHSLDVAATGYVFLKKHHVVTDKILRLMDIDLEREKFCRYASFFLALHDIGKFAESFQNLNPDIFRILKEKSSVRTYRTRHDSLGWRLWKDHLKKQFQVKGIIPLVEGSRRRQAIETPIDFWIKAMVGHHGQPPEDIFPRRMDDDFNGKDLSAVSQFLEDLIPIFFDSTPVFPNIGENGIKMASWWLSGLGVLSDWLGSNIEYFPYNNEEYHLKYYWDEFAIPSAQKAIEKTGVLKSSVSEKLNIHDFFGGGAEPTPLQKQVSGWRVSKSPQIFILEDVMGSGKTEAAILLAHRLMKEGKGSGFYFALPTMATSNTMYERMGHIYSKIFDKTSNPSIVLAHGSRDMSDQFRESIPQQKSNNEKDYGDGAISATSHCNIWLADNRKKVFLADVGVGTIDQALLAVLPSKHQSLRLLGLMNKILIVDEVHAYDAYMNEILNELLYAQATIEGSVILLSATLPKKERLRFLRSYEKGLSLSCDQRSLKDEYPLITSLGDGEVIEEAVETRAEMEREVLVHFLSKEEDVLSLIKETVSQGRCICWIRNTVNSAIESCKKIKEDYPEIEVSLFHARYALGDRLEIEADAVKRFGKKSTAKERRGRVLIATQVIEQSLDLDFDVLISDLSPIDLLLQRSGRLCRHRRDQEGNPIDGDGRDQRGRVRLYVFGPEFIEEPNENWYKDFFPNAAKIYEDHGQLWLAVKKIKEVKKIRIPQDMRVLIEGVYDNSRDEIPEIFNKSSFDAQANVACQKSSAKLNSLLLEVGYTKKMIDFWWDEGKKPTRLGEPTKTVYLSKENQEGEIVPWFEHEKYPWQMSGVSVRTYWADREYSNLSMDTFKANLPDKGKWSVLLSLKFYPEKQKWIGFALGEKGQKNKFVYCKDFGFEIKSPNEPD
ncbi:MAG: CRISPR-associated helicase Cas3' [Bacteriovoracales bacterium]|nr:CRISPR-associated helicase Cas3' [Bacteriovoracales bacterium]